MGTGLERFTAEQES